MTNSERSSIAVIEALHPAIVRDVIAHRVTRAILLETPDKAGRRAMRALKRAGVEVTIPDFFAGDILNARNESVWLAAARTARRVAPALAERLIGRSAILREIDSFGRAGTLALHLTKQLQPYLLHVAVRLEVARSMAAPVLPKVWLHVPSRLPVTIVRELAPDLSVHALPVNAHGVFGSLRPLLQEVRQTLAGLLRKPTWTPWRPEPTILTFHEEDLLEERSHRGQLHWLDAERQTPRCRVVMLPNPIGVHRNFTTATSLSRRRVTLLTEWDVFHCRRLAKNPVHKVLHRWGRACTRGILGTRSSWERFALVRALLLVWKARRIAAVAEATGARVWVSCENYFAEADAVNLIADACGMRTAAWQYSAMMTPTPLMLGTVDVLATFSDYFGPLYAPLPAGPKSLLPIGYPFGDVPQLVRGRATAIRAELEDRGARFVLCFFDESIPVSKWLGLASQADHRSILEALAESVLRNPDLGVLLKPKYAFHTVQRIYPDSDRLRRAAATGRLREVAVGAHRNKAFAAEAAMASDLCIGYLAGATATLESVIAGSRAVLLRRRGEEAQLEPALKGLDVIFPSIEAVLDAVAQHRAGTDHVSLGDWTPALAKLDAYRDGRAPRRLRELLEAWALGETAETHQEPMNTHSKVIA